MLKKNSPWLWVPSLYFAEGLPYIVINVLSLTMYKCMGISNAEIAFYTSWLNLPWVIKPLWSPFVDLLRTKRWWILLTQLLFGAGMAGVAFTIPTEHFFQITLALFWLLAFNSATHDIAADGFYMLGLSPHQQALFVGIRSTFYRIAVIAGQGLLIMLAGKVEKISGDIPFAWSLTFFVLAGLLLAIWAYHLFMLPHPASDTKAENTSASQLLSGFFGTVRSFFQKEGAVSAILFMLLYRFPEAQLVKMEIPFLKDPQSVGGLGMTTGEIGLTQGTIGVLGLVLGGILGGVLVARHGLGRWLWPMVCAISLPDAVFVVLSYFPQAGLYWVSACMFIEQFGYGFGFTAYMMFLIYYSRGACSTAHYAISTAFMALGMMLPGMAAGWLQEVMGYRMFFLWIMLCCVVTFVVTAFVKIDPKFGRK